MFLGDVVNESNGYVVTANLLKGVPVLVLSQDVVPRSQNCW
jgi:hypothetical protein